jgi:hypothetical protein
MLFVVAIIARAGSPNAEKSLSQPLRIGSGSMRPRSR